MLNTFSPVSLFITPYCRECYIHYKYSNTPIPESFKDYMPEVARHILGTL
jgi:hypothetical protein